MPQQPPESFSETGAELPFEGDEADNTCSKATPFLPDDMNGMYGSPPEDGQITPGQPMDGDSDLELMQVQEIVGGNEGRARVTVEHSVLKADIDLQAEQITGHPPQLEQRAIRVGLELWRFWLVNDDSELASQYGRSC